MRDLLLRGKNKPSGRLINISTLMILVLLVCDAPVTEP